MKRLFALLIIICSLSVNAQEQTNSKLSTVVFSSSISCEKCKSKIEKNIPFEKGVKALDVDLEKKTVTVTYRNDKNNSENLRVALEKLGYKSFIKSEN